MVDRENLVYRTSNYTYSFQNFWTINIFGRYICNGAVTTKDAENDQSDVLVEILNFRNR